jgi:hypothetical protein
MSELQSSELDEAARIALKMLAYAHPRIRSIKASQRHLAPAPDEERSIYDLFRLSEAELEWLATILASLPELEPEPERSAAPVEVLQPLDVVQQAIRQHRLAGRLQQAAALAVRVAPCEHPRIHSITDEERAAEAHRDERAESERERQGKRLRNLTAEQFQEWRGSRRRLGDRALESKHLNASNCGARPTGRTWCGVRASELRAAGGDRA